MFTCICSLLLKGQLIAFKKHRSDIKEEPKVRLGSRIKKCAHQWCQTRHQHFPKKKTTNIVLGNAKGICWPGLLVSYLVKAKN